MKFVAVIALLHLCACHYPNVKYRPVAQGSMPDLRNAVYELFWAYEMENSFRFDDLVSRDFRSNDFSGYAYIEPWFKQAVRDDFRNLDNPAFEVYVESVTPFEAGNLQRVQMRWFRRAVIPASGAEWILREQDSALYFKREADGWKLWSIEGAPIFGMSDPFGTIPLRDGTINNQSVSGRIENGRFVP